MDITWNLVVHDVLQHISTAKFRERNAPAPGETAYVDPRAPDKPSIPKGVH